MKTKKQAGKPFKCDQPGCGMAFTAARVLGAHKARVHGIAGTASSTLSKRRREAP
jgi:hypothetical protein